MDHSALSGYMAHGFCFLWEPQLVWLHVLSDITTGIAYYSIPIALFYFVYKRRDLPFQKIFLLFGVFIFLCGTTHFFAAYTVFAPLYWQEGTIKAVTAFISIISAILLIPLIPKAIALPSLTKALEDIKELNRTMKVQLEELRTKDYVLRESEERYRSLFENMLEGFAYCRMLFEDNKPQDFIYLEVNSAFYKLTGLKNVVGKNVTEVIPGIRDSDPELFEIYGRVALTGKPERFETYVEALKMWFSISVYSPEKEYFVAVFDVITERKQTEEKLRESEEKFRSIFDGAEDGILIADIETHKFLMGNNAICRMLGYTADEISGLGIMGIYDEKDLPYVLSQVEKQMRREIVIANDIPVRRKDGSIFYADIGSSHIVLGGRECLIGIFRDNTEKNKLENQLRQAQKMEAIGTLAGGVAHDFNNILSIIIGYGNLTLIKMVKDDPQRLNIGNMLEAADRATHLTKDLLLFSRKQVSELKPVDLNEVVRKVEKFLIRVIGEDIECKSVLHDQPVTVLADSHQLEQALMNLATNARDAMPKGGAFTVTTEQVNLNDDFISAHGYGKPGTYAMITVSDTGKGMDEETRTHIFEPFFTTKEVGKGTGLGLAVVYGIIKQHEGYINVYSEPGKGTTFRIYLPIIAIEVTEELKAHQEEAPAHGTETILLAEDNEPLRRLYSSVLQEFGYMVIEAVDGEEAVRKFMENKDRIQLLLFDFIMPKMNGNEAYDEIRKIRPDMKVIFSSGYAPDIVRKKASLETGAHLIYKPVSPFELLRKVRSVLDNKK